MDLCCAACRQDEGSVPAAGYSLQEACLLTRSSMPQQRSAALDLLRRVLLQVRSGLGSVDLRRGAPFTRATGVVGEGCRWLPQLNVVHSSSNCCVRLGYPAVVNSGSAKSSHGWASACKVQWDTL